ncbi:MAG: endonuclease/exonuclease/phosphatase family protein [Gemmatimonadales bacterium]
MRNWSIPTLPLCLLVAAACGETATEPDAAGVAAASVSADKPGAARNMVRFSTFNASLNRFNEGDLVSDLSTPNNTQAQTVAEIIQQARPDVLLINEFDYDAAGDAARLFQDNYLSIAQDISGTGTAQAIVYPYRYVAPSNTGIPSGRCPWTRPPACPGTTKETSTSSGSPRRAIGTFRSRSKTRWFTS